jgi:hypothetical protein
MRPEGKEEGEKGYLVVGFSPSTGSKLECCQLRNCRRAVIVHSTMHHGQTVCERETECCKLKGVAA